MTPIQTGERIGVLGLARSGVAAARLALSRGAAVYASDFSDNPATREAAERIRELGGDAEVGGHDLQKLARCSRIVLSPGIPPTAPVLRAPELAGIRIVAELEFAYAELEGPVIAITGTNGKTTVTALAAHLLRSSGIRAEAGGNIGTALSELVLCDPQPEVVVIEASSFQLGGMQDFSPDVGVLTNLAPDHLDWYPSVEAYYADKARLFRHATEASRWVLNAEDAEAAALPGDAPGIRYYFRVASEPEPGELGGYLDDEGWLVLQLEAGEEPLVRASELMILGPHNAANALAASIASRLVGGTPAGLAAGLRTFSPMDHRLEPVTEREGILWVNDSKATNIASTRVAIRSMERPIILLLGGRHKGEEYAALVPEVRQRVRAVIAFGEAAERIEEALGKAVRVDRLAVPFQDVLAHARAMARPGEVVLLSPACSSYDMFRDYEDRGRQFRQLVLEQIA
jgi:UDP-N-acetylmuramoylalanine--D-glutamate ligase